MSGKELNEKNKYPNSNNNNNPEGEENVEEPADDDFGDFEGFNNVNELEASVAQPLPQALQANWGSFPDYVPSQRTMSSSLQPDLLPTQATSIGDISGCASSNRADPQELFLQDHHDGNNEQYAPCDLPSAASGGSSQLHLRLQPDLGRSDFKLPDVSPQGGCSSGGEGADNRMPLLGNLPDISPVGCRQSHLSDLPDVSETRSCNQIMKGLPLKCDAGGPSAAAAASLLLEPCAAQAQQPCCSKSLANNDSYPKLNLHGNNNNVSDNIELVVSDFQQKFEELKQQNRALVQELAEMRSQNATFQHDVSETLGSVQRQNVSNREESVHLRSEVSNLCKGLANLKVVKNPENCSSPNVDHDSTLCNVAHDTKILEQHAASFEELQNHVANQDEQIRALRTELESASQKIEDVQQSQHQILDILKQTLDEFKSDRQRLSEKVESTENAVHACSAQLEKKVDQRTYTATLLDTLLLGARHQLQELVKPDNGPSS